MAKIRKNKEFNPMNCGVTHFMNKVREKWKVLVIHVISTGQNRFSLLKASIPHISKQMLINQLHEIEEVKIIELTVYAEVPPRVEYKISQYGYSNFFFLRSIQEWGLRDMQDNT